MSATLLLEIKDGLFEIEIRGVYGRELIYPANSLAQAFADLLEQKTFTPKQLEIIKGLGAVIEIKKQEMPK